MMSSVFLRNSKFSKPCEKNTTGKKKCSCIKCRCTKYIPVTTPRMNIYSVSRSIWFNDLKDYNEHLKRCFYAKTCLDTRPCRLNMKDRLNCAGLESDSFRIREIDMENKKMLKMFITIQRFGGVVNTVNSQVNMHNSKWLSNEIQMRRIDKENKLLYKRLQKVTSRYPYDPQEWKNWKKTLKISARYPLTILKKRDLDEEIRQQPSISTGLPKQNIYVQCFMDFEVYEGENLGRIIMVLYYYFEPSMVQQFLQTCLYSQELTYKNCPIHRIIKDKYLEAGDLPEQSEYSESTIAYQKTFNHVTNKLRHHKTGTVSMVRGKNLKFNSKFCITFCPMEELDRKNIVIGNVIKGADVLMKINGYGRKIGKPLVKILISNCGQLTNQRKLCKPREFSFGCVKPCYK